MSDEPAVPDELESLKTRATKLGITIDGRWGVEKLREVVNAAIQGVKPVTEQTTAPVTPLPASAAVAPVAAPAPAVKAVEPAPAPAVVQEAPVENEIKSPVEVTKMPSLADAMLVKEVADAGPETEGQRKNRLRREAMALVRVRVSCMDPQKKNLKGELLCISNKNFGTVQRFIPFNREWHIEKVLYDGLMEKEYMVFDREKTGRAGIEVVTPRNVPAFNIQVLPPLTKGELKDLAQRQAMADGTRQD
jgi:hypothetical protein